MLFFYIFDSAAKIGSGYGGNKMHNTFMLSVGITRVLG